MEFRAAGTGQLGKVDDRSGGGVRDLALPGRGCSADTVRTQWVHVSGPNTSSRAMKPLQEAFMSARQWRAAAVPCDGAVPACTTRAGGQLTEHVLFSSGAENTGDSRHAAKRPTREAVIIIMCRHTTPHEGMGQAWQRRACTSAGRCTVSLLSFCAAEWAKPSSVVATALCGSGKKVHSKSF